jgi:hypothetical protein
MLFATALKSVADAVQGFLAGKNAVVAPLGLELAEEFARGGFDMGEANVHYEELVVTLRLYVSINWQDNNPDQLPEEWFDCGVRLLQLDAARLQQDLGAGPDVHDVSIRIHRLDVKPTKPGDAPAGFGVYGILPGWQVTMAVALHRKLRDFKKITKVRILSRAGAAAGKGGQIKVSARRIATLADLTKDEKDLLGTFGASTEATLVLWGSDQPQEVNARPARAFAERLSRAVDRQRVLETNDVLVLSRRFPQNPLVRPEDKLPATTWILFDGRRLDAADNGGTATGELLLKLEREELHVYEPVQTQSLLLKEAAPPSEPSEENAADPSGHEWV